MEPHDDGAGMLLLCHPQRVCRRLGKGVGGDEKSECDRPGDDGAGRGLAIE